MRDPWSYMRWMRNRRCHGGRRRARDSERELREGMCEKGSRLLPQGACSVLLPLHLISGREGRKEGHPTDDQGPGEGGRRFALSGPGHRAHSLCVVLQGPSCSCLPSRSPAADTAEPATPALQYAAHPPKTDRQTPPHAAVVRLKLYHQPRFPNIDSRCRQTRDMESLRLC